MTHTHRRRTPLLAAGALVAATGLAGCRTAAGPHAVPLTPDSAAVLRDVAYLASEALAGRGTGTPGNDSAAAYLARRYAALGLQPAAGGSFLQPFTARSAAMAHAGRAGGLATNNVVALLPGTDPALRGQYVVVGAHFDHLGRSPESARDPEAGDAIRNGADDNASGTAAVLELARLLSRRPARRSVLFVNFSGEELGLLGSQYFVDNSPVPLDSVQGMLNFDMVGRLRNDKLLVYGVATSPEFPALVQSANTAGAGAPGLAVTAIGDGFGPSDHSSFYARDIPVLHFFTDLHDDYHRATDDTDKIDAGGEARVIALAERIVRDLGNRPSRLPFVRTAQPATSMGPRQGSNVYFGSVPDMGATDVAGLRVSGVRPGSPADRAGLMGGDVIVEFGGTPVKDLYEYTDALYSKKPGDVVIVTVLRKGERVTLTATLGERGA
jgi:hypothetical protein